MTTTSAILPSVTDNVSRSAPTENPTSAPLSQTDFLKLLMTQLKYQNPLEPMSDANFSAQLAQFSTLDGIHQLNASLSSMALQQSITQGANLIGKTVAYGSGASGKVDSLQVSNGQLILMVAGNAIPLSQVQQIAS